MTSFKDLFKPEKEYLIYQIADKLRTDKMSVYRWIERGDLKAERRPHEFYSMHFVYWVKGSDIINYLQKINE